MHHIVDTSTANQEKSWVAATSVAAAVFLTGMKLGVGLWTNSLGILSEAAHSGLDLLAAILTLWAVRAAARPADRKHTYGHGKYENVSALFETVLLLVTCTWIFYEAINRLFFRASVHVEVNIWSFAVIIISIIVDVTRSRALKRTAKKYSSQALEADALHFSTDVWSSSVVLLGLVAVLISNRYALPWLTNADSIAALGVALISIWVSLKLGKRSVGDLLDTIPRDLQAKVIDATFVGGVLEVRRARMRKSGPLYFADLTVGIASDAPLERAHQISENVEKAVQKILPGADVVVHVEPVETGEEGTVGAIRTLAVRHGLGAHNIRLFEDANGRSLELHLEVDDRLSVKDAHAMATKFELELYKVVHGLNRIYSHLEPTGDATSECRARPATAGQIADALNSFLKDKHMQMKPHDISVHMIGNELDCCFHLTVDPSINIKDAHLLTEEIERYVRSRVPNLGRIVIHIEPT